MKYLITTLLALFLSAALLAQTYMEEPVKNDSGAVYVTKRAVLDGKPMRSFTYKYDTSRRIALWVAYPLNTGLIGHGKRADTWLPDNDVSEDKQPALYKGFRYGSHYDRGHQIPSADRLDTEANAQTFLFTNATPQLHVYNEGVWAELEKVVRSWAKRSDTLYVVTGCLPGDNTINDNGGKPVNIPSAYYKAVLRMNTDKKGVVHWSACAVILKHEDIPKPKTWKDGLAFFRNHSLSIKDLEKVTGERYFTKLKDIVGNDEYNKIIGNKPAHEQWWWK